MLVALNPDGICFRPWAGVTLAAGAASSPRPAAAKTFVSKQDYIAYPA